LVRHEAEYEKSHMLRIGPRCNVNTSPVTVHGLLLSVTNDMSYLWVDLIARRKLKLSIHRRCMQFVRAFNALYAKLGCSSSEEVILHMTR